MYSFQHPCKQSNVQKVQSRRPSIEHPSHKKSGGEGPVAPSPYHIIRAIRGLRLSPDYKLNECVKQTNK